MDAECSSSRVEVPVLAGFTMAQARDIARDLGVTVVIDTSEAQVREAAADADLARWFVHGQLPSQSQGAMLREQPVSVSLHPEPPRRRRHRGDPGGAADRSPRPDPGTPPIGHAAVDIGAEGSRHHGANP